MKLIHLKVLTELKHFSAPDLFPTRFTLLIVETIITLYDFELQSGRTIKRNKRDEDRPASLPCGEYKYLCWIAALVAQTASRQQ